MTIDDTIAGYKSNVIKSKTINLKLVIPVYAKKIK